MYASQAHFVEVVHVLRTQIPFLGFDRHRLDVSRELERHLVGWRHRCAPVLAHIKCVAKREENWHCVSDELGAIVPSPPLVAVRLLIKKSEHEYGMLDDIRAYRSVVEKTYKYESLEELIASIKKNVIGPAEAKGERIAVRQLEQAYQNHGELLTNRLRRGTPLHFGVDSLDAMQSCALSDPDAQGVPAAGTASNGGKALRTRRGFEHQQLLDLGRQNKNRSPRLVAAQPGPPRPLRVRR